MFSFPKTVVQGLESKLGKCEIHNKKISNHLNKLLRSKILNLK